MKPRVLPEVHVEIVEAAKWYEARQAGYGSQFYDAYEEGMRKIQTDPQSFSRLETNRSRRDVRRCRLRRFPYYIAFEILPSEVVILAVAHGSRRPNYFMRRKP